MLFPPRTVLDLQHGQNLAPLIRVPRNRHKTFPGGIDPPEGGIAVLLERPQRFRATLFSALRLGDGQHLVPHHHAQVVEFRQVPQVRNARRSDVRQIPGETGNAVKSPQSQGEAYDRHDPEP